MCRYFQHVGRVGKDVQARASAGRRGRRGVEYSSGGGERADISPRRSRNTFTSTPRLLFSSYKACVKKSTCCLIFLHHMIPHTGNIENVQHIKKKSSGVADRIRRKQLSLQTCSHACSGSMLWGGDLCRKKAPEDRRQSNTGALYLREHKSSPHVRNKESEGLSGRSETSRGLWENPTTVSFHHVVS